MTEKLKIALIDVSKALMELAECLGENPKEPQKAYKLSDVRQALALKSREGHTAEIKALLNKYSANVLSEVKESDYPALMQEVEALG